MGHSRTAVLCLCLLWAASLESGPATFPCVEQGSSVEPESCSSLESRSLPLGLAAAFFSPPASASSVSHVTPCCRWGGSLALGIHTASVCVSRQWKQLLTEDEAVSPTFFAQGAVFQILKLNIFSPFPNGRKQVPLECHGTWTYLVGNHCSKFPLN